MSMVAALVFIILNVVIAHGIFHSHEECYKCFLGIDASCWNSNILIMGSCLLFAYFMARMCRAQQKKDEQHDNSIAQHEEDQRKMKQLLVQHEEDEKALRDAEKFFAEILANVKVIIVEFSSDGRIIWANQMAYDTFKIPEKCKEEGFHFVKVLDPNQVPLAQSRLVIMGQDGQVPNTRYNLGEFDTGVYNIPVEISTKVYNDKGEKRIIAVVRLIADELKLREEQEKVQWLESISTFAGGVAHDFNNILTSILGNLDLLKRCLESTCQEEESTCLAWVKAAIRGGDQARGLTGQLLSFSSGAQSVAENVAVEELIEAACQIAVGFSQSSACSVDVSENTSLVRGETKQLVRAFSNLVLNAVQSMPEGGLITVKATEDQVLPDNKHGLNPGNYVRVSISDQGCGIPPEKISEIFKPYVTTKKKGGTGLGLSVALGEAMKNGGIVTVESELDKGSTFHVFLPAISEKVMTKKASELQLEDFGLPRKSFNILIMDDLEELQKVLAKTMEMLGHDSCIVGRGEDVVRSYQEAFDSGDCFDLVILDQTIPGGMGGPETFAAIKAINPLAKIICMTGYASNSIEEDYNGFITKPYEISDMRKIIEQVARG